MDSPELHPLVSFLARPNGMTEICVPYNNDDIQNVETTPSHFTIDGMIYIVL